MFFLEDCQYIEKSRLLLSLKELIRMALTDSQELPETIYAKSRGAHTFIKYTES